MTARLVAVSLLVVFASAGVGAADTGPKCRPKGRVATPAAVARTPWGDPDLQGVWSGTDMFGVPMDRAPELGDRNVLTEEEFHARRNQQQQSGAADNIEATNFGAEPEPGGGNPTRQASLVIDPPNGRRPPRTPAAEAQPIGRTSFSGGSFNSALDFGVFDRCIAYATVSAATPGNGVEIVQAPGYVAIRTEVIHEAQIISLDGRPHVSGRLSSYMGDARGRWEGNTLIVETTNLNGRTTLALGGGRPSERARVIERYTRTTEDTLWYEMTIDDSNTWTRPWTLAFPRKRDMNYRLYEYACHEGNYGLRNILSAARALDNAIK